MAKLTSGRTLLYIGVLLTSLSLTACGGGGGGSGGSGSNDDGNQPGDNVTDIDHGVNDDNNTDSDAGSDTETETETETDSDTETGNENETENEESDTGNESVTDNADESDNTDNSAGTGEPTCQAQTYLAGTTYQTGDLVQNSNALFECVVGGWCSSNATQAYAPGTGLYWESAWVQIDTCSGEDSEENHSDNDSDSNNPVVDVDDDTTEQPEIDPPIITNPDSVLYAEDSGINFNALGGLGKTEAFRIIGYYMPSLDGSFPPSAIGAEQARQLTHINFAFMHLNDNYECDFAPGDDAEKVAGIIAELQQLKSYNPDLKILFSIGGWALSNDDSATVSNYRNAFTAANRNTMASSCVQFMTQYGFDGIDIDWEYPRSQDVDNFIAGLGLIRNKLDARNQGELLTIAGAGGAFYLSRYYAKLPEIVAELDFINLMSYDLNGPWNGVTATNHHAHLYGNSSEPKFYNALREANLGLSWEELTRRHKSPFALTVDAAVKQHLLMDIPREKVIMGVPFYGRAFFNVSDANGGLYQSFNTPKGDPYVGDPSLLHGCEPCTERNEPRIATYKEILAMKTGGWGYEYHFDMATKAVWLHHPEKNIFVTYDDPTSLRYKTDYIKAEGLGGAMFWHLGQDDSQFTMLDTLHTELNGDNAGGFFNEDVVVPNEDEQSADQGNSDGDSDNSNSGDSETGSNDSNNSGTGNDESVADNDTDNTDNTDSTDNAEDSENVADNEENNNNSNPQDYVVGTYFVEWGVYGRNYHVADMPAEDLTHVLYGFIPICGPNTSLQSANPSGYSALVQQCAGKPDYSVVVHDKFAALEKSYPGDQWDDPIRGNFGQLMKMKQQHPHIKVLPSVGGWTLSDPFFHLAGNATHRATFVNSVADFLRTYRFFDGVDIDWEFPGGGGANAALGDGSDYEAYADLMRDLRQALDNLETELDKELYLTSAIGASPQKIANVNYTRAQMYMDYIFLMSYDYYGAWNTELGHQTALYDYSYNQQDGFYTTASVDSLIMQGVPSQKIVVGVAMYGRGWSKIQGGSIDNPFTGSGTSTTTWQGEQVNKVNGTWEDGVLDYKDIVNNYLGGTQGTGINGYQYYYDETAEAPYLWNYSNGSLITYDNPRSTRAKGNYVQQHQLGGLFSWEIDADNGDMVDAMNEGLGQ